MPSSTGGIIYKQKRLKAMMSVEKMADLTNNSDTVYLCLADTIEYFRHLHSGGNFA